MNTLPEKRVRHRESNPGHLTSPETNTRRPTFALDVLVVDDDPLLREATAIMVEAMGCRVTMAEDGLVALDVIAKQPVDVLITDWQMPGLDGIGLVRHLRACQTGRALHIIMMTTRAAERTRSDGLAALVDEFLFKPIDPVQLEMSVASARRSIDLQRRLTSRNRHLAAAIQRVRTAYGQIRSDLDLAAATQRTLLPPPQSTGELRHAWLFIPSRGVGGDSLNLQLLPDGQRFFFQIDVSGHGLPAALRSFSLHHRLSARPPRNVAEMQAMVAALNNDAQDEPEGSYYTLLCGLIAVGCNRIDLIRAGHTMPMIIDTVGVRPVPEGNPPIGLLPGLCYDVISIELEPGGRLLMNSDGLADCTNLAGEDFGDARVAAFFADRRNLALGDCMTELEKHLRQFRGLRDFDDDVSVLIIEREG